MNVLIKVLIGLSALAFVLAVLVTAVIEKKSLAYQPKVSRELAAI